MAQKGEYFFGWGEFFFFQLNLGESPGADFICASKKRSIVVPKTASAGRNILGEGEGKKTQYKNNKVCFCSAGDKKKKKKPKPVRADGPRVERGRGGIL